MYYCLGFRVVYIHIYIHTFVCLTMVVQVDTEICERQEAHKSESVVSLYRNIKTILLP